MTFYSLCLPLSLYRVFKGRNGSIYSCSSIVGQRTYIHCMSIAKAVLMWCMECMCITPWRAVLSPVGPVRAGRRLPLHYRRTTSPYASLTLAWPTVPWPAPVPLCVPLAAPVFLSSLLLCCVSLPCQLLYHHPHWQLPVFTAIHII